MSLLNKIKCILTLRLAVEAAEATGAPLLIMWKLVALRFNRSHPNMENKICDPTTGVCNLPPPNEKKPVQSDIGTHQRLEILSKANVTSLNNDKGESMRIDALPSSPLVLLYFSAVPTFFGIY